MKLSPEDNLIVVHVEIFYGDKSRIVQMALDTGATYLMLPWNVVETLGYNPLVSSDRIPMTTASGIETVPLFTLEKVRVLGNEVQNVKAICHSLPPQSAVDGLLGLSFLKHFDVSLHFLQGRLKLDN